MVCSKCHQEIADNSIFCPICGYHLTETAPAPQEEPVAPAAEKSGPPNWLLFVLALLWPVIGIIFWAVYHNSNPSKGQAALRGAIISLIASAALVAVFLVIYLILFFVYFVILGTSFAYIM